MSFLQVQNQPAQLAGAGNSIGDTTVVLSSFLAIDGVTPLTMAMFGSVGYGTCEAGNGIQEEQISFTGLVQNANGTATLTGIKTVLFISTYTETSGFAKTHPGGSQFIISNTAGFYNKFAVLSNAETITAKYTFPNDANTPVLGASYVAPTTDVQIASKGYVDSVAIAGAPNASTAIQGLVQEATLAQINAGTATGSTGAKLFIQPATLLLSSYFLFLPTTTQKDALAGTGTPSAGNKFVTADTNALNELLSNKSTNTSLGSSDTLYPSQKAVKTYADSGVSGGNGTTTYDVSSASGTQNIAHGLGRTPRMVRIEALMVSDAGTKTAVYARTLYNGSTQSSQSLWWSNTGVLTADNSFKVGPTSGGGVNLFQSGVVTFDSTNIIITWTKSGTPTGTVQILWEAQ